MVYRKPPSFETGSSTAGNSFSISDFTNLSKGWAIAFIIIGIILIVTMILLPIGIFLLIIGILSLRRQKPESTSESTPPTSGGSSLPTYLGGSPTSQQTVPYQEITKDMFLEVEMRRTKIGGNSDIYNSISETLVKGYKLFAEIDYVDNTKYNLIIGVYPWSNSTLKYIFLPLIDKNKLSAEEYDKLVQESDLPGFVSISARNYLLDNTTPMTKTRYDNYGPLTILYEPRTSYSNVFGDHTYDIVLGDNGGSIILITKKQTSLDPPIFPKY